MVLSFLFLCYLLRFYIIFFYIERFFQYEFLFGGKKGDSYFVKNVFVNVQVRICSLCSDVEVGVVIYGGDRLQGILQVMLRNYVGF